MTQQRKCRTHVPELAQYLFDGDDLTRPKASQTAWILVVPAVRPSNSAASLHAFIRRTVKPGTSLLTDGHSAYPGLADYCHAPRTVGSLAGHVVLPWIHRVFSLINRWGLGTYHDLRDKHLDAYLNEFTFRFYRHVSFETMLGIAFRRDPAPYSTIVTASAPQRCHTVRQTTKSRST